MVIGDHFGGGDHFDGGDHFGGGTRPLSLDISLRFCPKSSLPCILLDAQIDLLRREARQTSIILVQHNFNHIKN